MYVWQCVLGVSILTLPTILIFDFRIVLTVCFFSFYFIHKSGLTPPLFIEVPVPSHEKWALIHLWVWGWFMLFNTTIYWSACTKPWKVSGHSFVGLGLAYVGCLTPLFIEVPVPSHESERSYICGFGVGLCCLTSLSTIFQLYRDGQLYWWENRRKPPTYIIGVVIAMILV